jgi:DNA-binding NarL/FixJ family response regulator
MRSPGVEGTAMRDDGDAISVYALDEGAQIQRAYGLGGPDLSARMAWEGFRVKLGGYVAIVESRVFLRECIRMSLQAALPLPVIAYASEQELERDSRGEPEAVLWSALEASHEGSARALTTLARIVPQSPVIVLGAHSGIDMARLAVHHGAKAYIPYATGFDLAIEAVRFVLSGGTYVPVECLLHERHASEAGAGRTAVGPQGITEREQAVVRAIQQGKSNKVIAYELNLCESTVKVHVRRIMKKLKAKNRTEVAIRAQAGLRMAGA